VLALLTLGIDVSKVTLLAGALSVGMGFGLQNIVNNFFSGLILLFERPIHQGDVVEVGKLRGTVTKIGIRSSLIKTSEGAEVIVPNANLISKEVVNWTLSDRRRRIEIPVRVNRNVDEEDLLALLLTVARASNEVLADPVPEAMLRETNADSMDFVLACWIQRYEDQRRIASRLRIAINHKLAERGIAGPPPVTEVEVIRHGPGE
jgi:small-conductance mechanosensitive channel